MPILLRNIKTPFSASQNEVIEAALKKFKISPSKVENAAVYKSSLDARKHDNILLVSTVILTLNSRDSEQRYAKFEDVTVFEESVPIIEISKTKRHGRTVVAGFGPAGMFCALLLAENGYRPIVLERGADVDSRVKKVEDFWLTGNLDENTNVQFGEGGAGTFSDGKLTTRIGDSLCRYVLKRLVDMGAPEEILTTAKPHIGTDKLRFVVKNIRKRIIELGGEVRFLTPLQALEIDNNSVCQITTPDGKIETASLVLALGHSARDTFKMLINSGVYVEPKAFSVGARIEHLQSRVDESLYGNLAGDPKLPKGEYQLSHRRGDRAVYTFCMCPGGSVVAAASEKNSIVTNGMSEFARDRSNANAAVVVSVSKNDFGSGVLDGVDFARILERRAYDLSGSYAAPCSSVGTFLGEATKYSVKPTYRPGVVDTDLDKLFPTFVSDMMKEGIRKFSHKMSCFGDMNALLTAPETRTSSPVRITRNDNALAIGFDNLYPCGEGAGYAGGIVSAAVDGIKTAIALMKSYSPEQ